MSHHDAPPAFRFPGSVPITPPETTTEFQAASLSYRERLDAESEVADSGFGGSLETPAARVRRGISGLAYRSSTEPRAAAAPHERVQQRPQQGRGFIIIIPPSFLLQDHGNMGHTLSSGPQERLSQGILMPLFPTMYSQLTAIAKEFSFPSIAGLCLYYHYTENNMTMTPRIADETWSAFWGHAFDPSMNSTNNNSHSFRTPSIHGKVEFDIDYNRARWLTAWRRSARGEQVERVFAPSTTIPQSHARHDTGNNENLGDSQRRSLRPESQQTERGRPAHLPRQLSLVGYVPTTPVGLKSLLALQSEHPNVSATLSPIPQVDEPRSAALQKVRSWRESYSRVDTDVLLENGAPLSGTATVSPELQRAPLDLNEYAWSVSSHGPADYDPLSYLPSPDRLSSIDLPGRLAGSPAPSLPDSYATSWGPSDYTRSPISSIGQGSRMYTPDIARRMMFSPIDDEFLDMDEDDGYATSWGPPSDDYDWDQPVSPRARSVDLGERAVFTAPNTAELVRVAAGFPAHTPLNVVSQQGEAAALQEEREAAAGRSVWKHVQPYHQNFEQTSVTDGDSQDVFETAPSHEEFEASEASRSIHVEDYESFDDSHHDPSRRSWPQLFIQQTQTVTVADDIPEEHSSAGDTEAGEHYALRGADSLGASDEVSPARTIFAVQHHEHIVERELVPGSHQEEMSLPVEDLPDIDDEDSDYEEPQKRTWPQLFVQQSSTTVVQHDVEETQEAEGSASPETFDDEDENPNRRTWAPMFISQSTSVEVQHEAIEEPHDAHSSTATAYLDDDSDEEEEQEEQEENPHRRTWAPMFISQSTTVEVQHDEEAENPREVHDSTAPVYLDDESEEEEEQEEENPNRRTWAPMFISQSTTVEVQHDEETENSREADNSTAPVYLDDESDNEEEQQEVEEEENPNRRTWAPMFISQSTTVEVQHDVTEAQSSAAPVYLDDDSESEEEQREEEENPNRRTWAPLFISQATTVEVQHDASTESHSRSLSSEQLLDQLNYDHDDTSDDQEEEDDSHKRTWPQLFVQQSVTTVETSYDSPDLDAYPSPTDTAPLAPEPELLDPPAPAGKPWQHVWPYQKTQKTGSLDDLLLALDLPQEGGAAKKVDVESFSEPPTAKPWQYVWPYYTSEAHAVYPVFDLYPSVEPEAHEFAAYARKLQAGAAAPALPPVSREYLPQLYASPEYPDFDLYAFELRVQRQVGPQGSAVKTSVPREIAPRVQSYLPHLYPSTQYPDFALYPYTITVQRPQSSSTPTTIEVKNKYLPLLYSSAQYPDFDLYPYTLHIASTRQAPASSMRRPVSRAYLPMLYAAAQYPDFNLYPYALQIPRKTIQPAPAVLRSVTRAPVSREYLPKLYTSSAYPDFDIYPHTIRVEVPQRPRVDVTHTPVPALPPVSKAYLPHLYASTAYPDFDIYSHTLRITTPSVRAPPPPHHPTPPPQKSTTIAPPQIADYPDFDLYPTEVYSYEQSHSRTASINSLSDYPSYP